MKLGGGYRQVTKGYRKRALTRIFYDSTTTGGLVGLIAPSTRYVALRKTL